MKFSKSLMAAGLLTAGLGFVSCAAIMSGNKQDVKVASTPTGAEVWVNGEQVGTTPMEVKLRRGKEHVVEIKKAGYKTSRITTDKSLNSWIFGNLLCGGIPGGVVDFVTGSAWDVDPENIVVTLNQGTGSIDKIMPQSYGNLELRSDAGDVLGNVRIVWE